MVRALLPGVGSRLTAPPRFEGAAAPTRFGGEMVTRVVVFWRPGRQIQHEFGEWFAVPKGLGFEKEKGQGLKRTIWIGFAGALLLPVVVLAGVGASWLKLPMAPRSAALGEATVAWPAASEAVWINPAALALGWRAGGVFGHSRWIADIRSTSFEGHRVGKGGTWALFGSMTTVPGLERRVTATSEPLGVFSVHQIQAGAGFGTVVGGKLAAGVSVKWVYEKIHLLDGKTVALDLGVASVTPVAGFRFGVSLRNAGPAYRLGTDTVLLPASLSTGVARSFAFMGRPQGLRTWLGWRRVRGEGGHIMLGGELRPLGGMSLRMGYQSGYESRGISFGVGIHVGRVYLDYAALPFQDDLGQAHLVSVGFGL